MTEVALGGNVTGVYTSGSDEQIYAKQFEFVREITRPKAHIAWFGPRQIWDAPPSILQRSDRAIE